MEKLPKSKPPTQIERVAKNLEKERLTTAVARFVERAKSDLTTLGWQFVRESQDRDEAYNVYSHDSNTIHIWDCKIYKFHDGMIEQAFSSTDQGTLVTFSDLKSKGVSQSVYDGEYWNVKWYNIRFHRRKTNEGLETSVLLHGDPHGDRNAKQLCRIVWSDDGKVKIYRDSKRPISQDLEMIRRALGSCAESLLG